MDDFSKLALAFFGGIVTIAIWSVIVGPKSQAPAAAQTIFTGVAKVVAAAVNPVSASYGYGSGAQTSTTPASYQPGWQSFNGILAPISSSFGGSP